MVLTQEKITRINELAKLAKSRELTKDEKNEQEGLRKEYIKSFRESFKKQLDNIEIVD